jgi:hypothetical protein
MVRTGPVGCSPHRMKGSSILLRGFALIFATVYLAIASGIVPLAVAGVETLSGEHRVRVQLAEDHLDVVLAHDRSKIAGSLDACPPGHHHSLATRLVCLLAEQAPGHPDHVFHFSRTHDAVDELASYAVAACCWVLLSPLPYAEFVLLPQFAPKLILWAPRSPPRLCDTILTLRSTVLVI